MNGGSTSGTHQSVPPVSASSTQQQASPPQQQSPITTSGCSNSQLDRQQQSTTAPIGVGPTASTQQQPPPSGGPPAANPPSSSTSPIASAAPAPQAPLTGVSRISASGGIVPSTGRPSGDVRQYPNLKMNGDTSAQQNRDKKIPKVSGEKFILVKGIAKRTS